ncbi:MAG: hypothetical protein AAGA55_03675 [Planctomycetota bacterium]
MSFVCASALASPFAAEVISYDQGSNAAGGFTDASTALGSAERFTGEGVFPGGVTPFFSAFGTDEIVSIGSGGELTLRMGTAITNDASHAFGVDMIVFGNAAFVDQSFFDADPNNDGTGVLGDDPALFGAGGVAEVYVSADGVDWRLAATTAIDLFPTLGYQDFTVTAPPAPGSVPTNFQQAMDPSIGLADLAGLSYTELLDVYGSSGGGVGIDISGTGLNSAEFVRFVNNDSAAFEIDAVVAVPTPGALGILAVGMGLAMPRRRKA